MIEEASQLEGFLPISYRTAKEEEYLPAPFLEVMKGISDNSVPAWDVALRSYFWEEIKTRTAVHRVVSLKMMLLGGQGVLGGLGSWRVSRA